MCLHVYVCIRAIVCPEKLGGDTGGGGGGTK